MSSGSTRPPHVTHSTAHSAHQGAAKNLAKCEFVLGVALLMTQTLGNAHLPHTEERIGELMLYTELMRACMRAAEADADARPVGRHVPGDPAGREHPQPDDDRLSADDRDPAAAGLVELSADPERSDFDGPLAPQIEQYLATDNTAAKDRVKLFRLAWDVAGSAFGSRQVLYERFFASDPLDPRPRDGGDLSEGRDDGRGCWSFWAERRRLVDCQLMNGGGQMAKRPMYLQHVNLYVRNAERSKQWYEDLLGLHTYEYRPGWAAFMSADEEQSHEVALMQLGDDAPLQQKRQVGLNHMAWRLESLDDLKEFYS